ncbi:MAG: protein kinase [Planctomycetes bacterium]|nr:protein kinase [Planctomycetota bacterium]
MSADEKDQRLLLELAGDPRAPVELPRQGVMKIGSSKEKSDLHLEGQGVADVHCAIGRAKSGGWALKDLGSEYGTIVNGERVQSHKLEAGDLVLLGSRRLRVIGAEARAAAAPASVASPNVVPPSGAAANVAQAPLPSAGKPAAPIQEVPLARGGDSVSKLPQVKGYRVEKPLGRGGMGEVYLAVQESLGRPVALKVLASKLAADTDFVKRFQAEARAAAALNHPNVVTVHDVWEESGRHFLAMEFMDRGNLEQRLQREGKLTSKESLEILTDTAKALVYAELRGIVHRDIKPANLMQNSVGTNKLADLGLAMHLEAEATESDNKKIYGTPHFISPEQARGEKVDVRSDMYSLGATLYRLLSGRTPFEGATTRDILRGHFLEAPKPLVELAPDVPAGLAAIVHRLLEKKPDARYPTAAVLLQEVEKLRSAALVGAGAQALPRSGSKAPLILAVAVVALGATAFFVLRGGESPSNGGSRIDDPRSAVEGPDHNPTRTSSNGSADAPEVPDRPRVVERDDDTALKLREVEAENALFKIAADLPPDERRVALEELAVRFEGTAAANKAREEAERLRIQAEEAAAQSSAQSQAAQAWTERLRLAARTDSGPKPLAEALRSMLAFEIPSLLASNAAALEQRRAIFAETIRAALERARADLAAADAAEQAGKFDEFEQTLRPWLTALDLPPMPVELGFEALPDLGEVLAQRGAIQKRLEGLSTARARFEKERRVADRGRLASAMRGERGVGAALASFDFGAAERLIAELESSLATEDARGFAQALGEGVRAGNQALLNLAAEFDKGGWKRKTITDPRAKGRVTREVIGASAQGITVKVDGNADLLPWSAFGSRSIDLHQLFHQRLTREYAPAELRGIELLVRVSAVTLAAHEAADMLSQDSKAVLSEDEERQILEAFDAARAWAQLAGTSAACEREVEAARVLIEALRASTDGAWSRSVASIERLLDEFAPTLLVRFISDGRGA